jgi:inosose dehydratase
MDRFQVGYHAITWQFGPEGLERGFKDIAELGFKYVETLNRSTLADDFARRNMHPDDLGLPSFVSDIDYFSWLNLLIVAKFEYGVQPTSVYCNGQFIDPSLTPVEIAQFRGIAAVLHGLGAQHLVCGGGPPTDGDHTTDEYRAMARTLGEIGRHCQEFGIQLCYHPHLDTFVQTGPQLERFVEATDGDLVALCIDPSHLTIKGADAVDVFRTYIDRIKYCHFKDVKGENLGQLRGRARYDTFAELGEGQIDFRGIVEVLRRHDYAGPIIIELDRSTRTARESAVISKRYMTDVLGIAV